MRNADLFRSAGELPDDDRDDVRAVVCRYCDGPHTPRGCPFLHGWQRRAPIPERPSGANGGG